MRTKNKGFQTQAREFINIYVEIIENDDLIRKKSTLPPQVSLIRFINEETFLGHQ